jgi:hypothetical protein
MRPLLKRDVNIIGAQVADVALARETSPA